MRAVDERSVLGWTAGAGALLAVPSMVWPTANLALGPPVVPGLDQGGLEVLRFQLWSWGKITSESLSIEGGSTTGSLGDLVLLGGAIVLGLVAATLLNLARTAAVTPVGVAAISFSLAVIGSNMLGRVLRGGASFGVPDGQIEIIATPAGVLETGSVALLVLALVLLLAGSVRLTAVDLRELFRSRSNGGDAGGRAAPPPDEGQPGPSAPVVREAGLRDRRRAAGPAEGVGFSDD